MANISCMTADVAYLTCLHPSHIRYWKNGLQFFFPFNQKPTLVWSNVSCLVGMGKWGHYSRFVLTYAAVPEPGGQKRKGRYRNGVWDDRYTGLCKSVCGHISSNGLISFAKAHGVLENNTVIMQPKGAGCTFNVSVCRKNVCREICHAEPCVNMLLHINLHLCLVEKQGKYELS